MKQLIIAAFSLLIFGTSCSKSNNKNSSGEFYVKFKTDGVQQELRSDSRISGGHNSNRPQNYYGINTYSFGFTGYGDEYEAYPSLQISLESPAPIKTDVNYVSDASRPIIDGALYLYYSEGTDTFEKVIHYIDSKDVKLKITEIGEKYVRGTFSGTVITSDKTKQVVITEGEFYGLRGS